MIDSKYRSLLWELIAALDTGKHGEVTVEEIQSYGRAGAISLLLGNSFGRTADFSFLSENDWRDLNQEVAAMLAAEDSPWRFVAKNKGIVLLIALALQGAEQQFDAVG
jgi:hypothetical protein